MFGREAETENGGLHVERFWLRYKFEGTPLTLFVGAELKQVGVVGIFGNDDPGLAWRRSLGSSSCRPRPTWSAKRSASA